MTISEDQIDQFIGAMQTISARVKQLAQAIEALAEAMPNKTRERF